MTFAAGRRISGGVSVRIAEWCLPATKKTVRLSSRGAWGGRPTSCVRGKCTQQVIGGSRITSPKASCQFHHSRDFSSSPVESEDSTAAPVKAAARTKVNQKKSDPLAKRPSKKCDPYGNNGQPLSMQQIQLYIPTIDSEWRVNVRDVDPDNNNAGGNSTDLVETEDEPEPYSLTRQFYHANYLDASKFVTTVAAVCHLQNHFAKFTMERKLHPQHKTWVVVLEIECTTPILNGLSINDFHVAMLMDVECQRSIMQQLVLPET
jgi:pterin-4a-carbinolamine dehydratase